jgi:predicted ArsR family transcriptional regulator
MARRTPAARTLASGSRIDLLHRLQQGGSFTTPELAVAVGLHENTVREHLQRLVDDGYVVREPERRTSRGRPRTIYRAASAGDVRSDPDAAERLEQSIAQVALTKVLLEGYGREVGSVAEAARSAGRALAVAPGPLHCEHTTPPVDDDGQRQLDALEGHLDRLGFDPQFEDDGRPRFHLWRCPFLELAMARPEVVCNVHLGLASGVLDATGGPVRPRVLRPFVGREHCILELERAPA